MNGHPCQVDLSPSVQSPRREGEQDRGVILVITDLV